MPRIQVTMQDVAAKAGVSQTLVSFYLTGRQSVSPETAQRIQAAIEELDYHPNALARSLRLKRSGAIGVMVPFLTNPSFAIMAAAAEAVLAASQMLTFIWSTGPDPERRRAYFRALRMSHAEGLLVFPSYDIVDQINAVARQGIPVVLMERDLTARQSDLVMDAVIMDNGLGVRQATEHLLKLGHTRIGLINLGKDSPSAAQRTEAYKQPLASYDQEFDEELIAWFPGTPRGGYQATHHLLGLADPPTAVVVTTNMQTVGVLSAIGELGLEMPKDLSVIGFGHPGFELWPAIPLTVISQDVDAVGRAAAEMLLARLRGEEAGSSRTITLATQLEIKASTCTPTNRHRTYDIGPLTGARGP